jgi:phage shock protein PspC (stress-responsive transcriptional regulator)
MKKVININFQGSVVAIEETAYEILKQYTESLRTYFANEEGRDEIINDIESRISELFQGVLKKGAACITDDDVNAIIKNIGRPQDFEEEETAEAASSAKTKTGESGEKSEGFFNQNFTWNPKRLYRDENNKILGGVCSGIAAYLGIDPVIVRILFIISGIGIIAYLLLWIFIPGSNSVTYGVRKRLYRNPDGKIIGGVCNGIGSYFNINPWIPRAFFLIPFFTFFLRWHHFGPFNFPNFLGFTFSPGSFIIYVILWLVIPEATTTSEKLEMKGEKIDLNSIKNSVVEEMKGVKERVGKLGKEAGTIAKERGSEIGKEMQYAAKRSSGALGNVIVTIFKAFAYFILGSIALGLIVALFALVIVSIGIFPYKYFILTDGWQNILAWGTLIFFIIVPIIGIITFIIRRFARIKGSNRMMRASFLGLWILGIACFIALTASVSDDFRRSNSANEVKIVLPDPGVKKLEISSYPNNRYDRFNRWLNFEPFPNFEDDTLYIGTVRLEIEKSPTDSFQVGLVKLCNGSTRRDADTLASLIKFRVVQSDSTLYIDRAIAINTTDKFRNQSVILIVYVPENDEIRINKNMGFNNYRISFPWNHDDWFDWDENGYYYDYGVDYIMKADGLYTTDGIRSDKRNNDYNSDYNYDQSENSKENHSYRYNRHDKIDSLRAIKEMQMQKMQKSIDSLKAAKDKEIQKQKDSLNTIKNQIEQKIEKLDQNAGNTSDSGSQLINKGYNFIMYI